MSVLIDTCVLIPLFNPDAQLHHESRIAVRRLRATQEELVVTAQNFAEFWNVSTRLIQHNGRGLAMPQVARMVDMIRRFSRLQLESETSLNIWLKLVQQLHVTGTSVHDARLVAIMLEGGIDRILTYNEGDFRRYEVLGIQALSALFFDGLVRPLPACFAGHSSGASSASSGVAGAPTPTSGHQSTKLPPSSTPLFPTAYTTHPWSVRFVSRGSPV